MRRLAAAAIAVVFVAALPSLASEPGQPLDCSDWVFLEPGLSCVPWATGFGLLDEGTAMDSSGRLFRSQWASFPKPAGCLYNGDSIPGVSFVYFDGTGETVVAVLAPRCNGSAWEFAVPSPSATIEFDHINGAFLLQLESEADCIGNGAPCPTFQRRPAH